VAAGAVGAGSGEGREVTVGTDAGGSSSSLITNCVQEQQLLWVLNQVRAGQHHRTAVHGNCGCSHR
jgi:hypothetical protein